MVAFVPISPAAARELLAGISADDRDALLSDFVEAGLIKAYARKVETLRVDGGCHEVRGAQVAPALWKRVVAEQKVDELLGRCSTKLGGDGLVGGRPAVAITGIGFNEPDVRAAAARHGAKLAPSPAPAGSFKPNPAPIIRVPAVLDAPPLIQHEQNGACEPKRQRSVLGDDAVTVSIKETEDILGVSRGTVNNLIKRGVLETRKIGSRTLILAESIRVFLKGK